MSQAAIPYSPHLQAVLVLLAGALAITSLVMGRTSFTAVWRPLKGRPAAERRRIHKLAIGGGRIADPGDAALAGAHALAWLRTFDTPRYRLRMRLLQVSMLLAFGYPLAVNLSRGNLGRAFVEIAWLGLCAAALPYMQRVNENVRITAIVNNWADDTAVVDGR